MSLNTNVNTVINNVTVIVKYRILAGQFILQIYHQSTLILQRDISESEANLLLINN